LNNTLNHSKATRTKNDTCSHITERKEGGKEKEEIRTTTRRREKKLSYPKKTGIPRALHTKPPKKETESARMMSWMRLMSSY
jgi:hypothetical protein